MDSTRQGIQISEPKMANMAAALRAFFFFLFFLLAFTTTTRTTVVSATTFWVENRCSYTVWAAATPVGGGRELRTGQQWSFTAAAGTTLGRIWPRTGCHFDSSGRGSCETGDCGGLLQCTGWGKLPATLAEYALKQYNNLDFYDISLVDGFNVPLSITPTSACKKVSCNKDINAVCPSELKVQGGCDSACTKFGSPQYCCTGAYLNNCPATSYSRFFKNLCPQAYSYARDDATSTFTCPFGTDYRVVFCDTSSSSSSSSISVSSIQSESQSESETESRLVSQV